MKKLKEEQSTQHTDPYAFGYCGTGENGPVVTANNDEVFEQPQISTAFEVCVNYADNRANESKKLRKKKVIPPAPRRNYNLCYDLHRSGCSANSANVDEENGVFSARGIGAERVELQIEGLSTFVGRGMLIVWYVVVVIAVVIQSLEFLSLGLMSICGNSVDDLRDYSKWSSQCVTYANVGNLTESYALRWEGGPYSTNLDDSFVRFTNIVISLASPDDWYEHYEPARSYNLRVLIPQAFDEHAYLTLPILVTCHRSSPRCEYAVLSLRAVLNSTIGDNKSLTILDVPPALARVANKSSIGILFVKPGYYLGTFIWRYVLLILSILHLVRFIVYKKFTSTIYEQGWVIVLQLFLIWYLNPFFALNVWRKRSSLILEFFESDIPTWFAAVFVGFMLSAITASMPWKQRPPRVLNEQPPVYNLLTISGIKGFLAYRSSIYDPPLWTKLAVVIFIVLIILLDISGAVLFFVLTVSKSDVIWAMFIYFIITSIIIIGCFVCCGLLFHLHRNVGLKSYLDSRPQHLACRVFILVFTTAIIYFMFHFLIFYFYYFTIPGMRPLQSLTQLPAFMVASIFVNIMTLIYTTRNRDYLVPIHPRDERWKYMVWPDTWYRWLSRHGGSMYIFHTEKEEVYFNWNQYEFRMRQHKAKMKKKRKSRRNWFLRRRKAVTGEEGSNINNNNNNNNQPFQDAGNTFSIDAGEFHDIPLQSPARKKKFLALADGDQSVINMDKTSTWFLPVRPLRHEVDSEQPSVRSAETYREALPDDSKRCFVRRHSTDVAFGNNSFPLCSPLWNLPQVSFHLSGYTNQREATMEDRLRDLQDLPPGRPSFEQSVAVSTSSEETTEDEMGGTVTRTLERAREKIGSILKTAGRTFISGPIHAFTHFETTILDAAIRPFQDVEYLPFFNLETAIDCFNLSWEAYGCCDREERIRKKKIFSSSNSCCRQCLPLPASSTFFEGEQQREMEDTSENGPDTCTCAKEQLSRETGERRESDSSFINVEQYGYSLIFVFNKMDVQLILCTMDSDKAKLEGRAQRVVISFRGTATISNAWQDLRVNRKVWDEMMEENETVFQSLRCCRTPTVHVGFLSIWKAFRDEVHEKLWGLLNADPSTVYRIICTGHSLGGALACLCAYSVSKFLGAKNYPLSEVTVYTFGQPPVGNRAFKSAYNKAVPRTFRVVNESDAISLIQMYGSHVGVEVNIDRYGNYICKPTYMERLFRPTKGRGFSIEHHLMTKYSDSLNAIAKNTKCRAVACVKKAPETENNVKN